MLASTFHDIFNGLAARDTAVEQHKLNRMLSGKSALALHGIDTGGKPEFLDLTVFEPNAKQIEFLVHDVVGLVDAETGKALPIAQMRELNGFTVSRKDVIIRITLDRVKPIPDSGLLFRYGGTFHRVMGVNDIGYLPNSMDAVTSEVYAKFGVPPGTLKAAFVNAKFGVPPGTLKAAFVNPQEQLLSFGMQELHEELYGKPTLMPPAYTITDEPKVGQEFLDNPLPSEQGGDETCVLHIVETPYNKYDTPVVGFTKLMASQKFLDKTKVEFVKTPLILDAKTQSDLKQVGEQIAQVMGAVMNGKQFVHDEYIIGEYQPGQEFLDNPLPSEGYDVMEDVDKVIAKLKKVSSISELKALFAAYELLKKCNKIDPDLDEDIRQAFQNRELEINYVDPEG